MKESYKKFIENITHFFVRKSIQSTQHKATKSWLTGIILSTCIGILLCGVGVYVLFFSKSKEAVIPPTSTSTALFFSDSRLDAIVEQFRDQTERFNDMRQNAPVVLNVEIPEIPADAGETEEDSEDTEREIPEEQGTPTPQM